MQTGICTEVRDMLVNILIPGSILLLVVVGLAVYPAPVAWVINQVMPSDWHPGSGLQWMWRYRFVRRKRGTRKCGHCGTSERLVDLIPWGELRLTKMMEGRTNRAVVVKRPPVCCANCLQKLKRAECNEIRVSIEGDVQFMINGKPSARFTPGEGLRYWATEL